MRTFWEMDALSCWAMDARIVTISSPLRGFLMQSHFAPEKVNFAPFWVHL
jgi:hypothetical protein